MKHWNNMQMVQDATQQSNLNSKSWSKRNCCVKKNPNSFICFYFVKLAFLEGKIWFDIFI